MGNSNYSNNVNSTSDTLNDIRNLKERFNSMFDKIKKANDINDTIIHRAEKENPICKTQGKKVKFQIKKGKSRSQKGNSQFSIQIFHRGQKIKVSPPLFFFFVFTLFILHSFCIFLVYSLHSVCIYYVYFV